MIASLQIGPIDADRIAIRQPEGAVLKRPSWFVQQCATGSEIDRGTDTGLPARIIIAGRAAIVVVEPTKECGEQDSLAECVRGPEIQSKLLSRKVWSKLLNDELKPE